MVSKIPYKWYKWGEQVGFDHVESDQVEIDIGRNDVFGDKVFDIVIDKIEDYTYRLFYVNYSPSKTFDYPSNGAGIMDFRRHDTTIV